MRAARGLVLDIQEGKMYWNDENPWFSCANLDGSNPRQLTTDAVFYSGDIALIPEPATLSLLATAGLAGIFRQWNAG